MLLKPGFHCELIKALRQRDRIGNLLIIGKFIDFYLVLKTFMIKYFLNKGQRIKSKTIQLNYRC